MGTLEDVKEEIVELLSMTDTEVGNSDDEFEDEDSEIKDVKE
jgi:hypothetical protein